MPGIVLDWKAGVSKTDKALLMESHLVSQTINKDANKNISF